MEKQTAILTFEVVDQDTGVGRVVDAQGMTLPTDMPTLEVFREYPNGTLIQVTILKTGDRSIQFLDHKVLSDEKQADPDLPPAEWVKVGSEYFSPEEYELFETLTRVLEFDGQVNLMVVGPSGYGKSSRAKAWAEAHGMRYLRKDCSLIREPEEAFGYRELTKKGTEFVSTDLTNAIREGNAVILLDEFNRTEPWLLNSLFPILDFERATTVHNERIECGPNVLFVATANIGLEYVGTFMMDKALTNRFNATMSVSAPPPHVEQAVLQERYGTQEEDAQNIVHTLNVLRSNGDSSIDASTRTALKVAALVKAGMTIRQAFEYALINATEFESRKEIRDIVNSELGVL